MEQKHNKRVTLKNKYRRLSFKDQIEGYAVE